MRKNLAPLMTFLALSAFAAVASADVAPRCKCEAPGTTPAGGAAAAFVALGAAIVVVARKRARKS